MLVRGCEIVDPCELSDKGFFDYVGVGRLRRVVDVGGQPLYCSVAYIFHFKSNRIVPLI